MDHLTSLEWIIQTRRCKAYITHDHMQPYSHLPETTRIELNQPSQMSLSIKYQLHETGLFVSCMLTLSNTHSSPLFFCSLVCKDAKGMGNCEDKRGKTKKGRREEEMNMILRPTNNYQRRSLKTSCTTRRKKMRCMLRPSSNQPIC